MQSGPTPLFVVPRIYLASKSPRRRELLKQIGVSFEMLLFREQPPRGTDVDESPLPGESPRAYVERVSLLKAEMGWLRVVQRSLRKHPVLAADTTVALGDRILGKPANREEAAEMLQALSGRDHQVFTAVAVKLDTTVHLTVTESIVTFAKLSDREIQAYVHSGEPVDKAGGYGIQGAAQAFIPQIAGSYSGVMGLPLFETVELLRRFPA
jgi:septum formation protein